MLNGYAAARRSFPGYAGRISRFSLLLLVCHLFFLPRVEAKPGAGEKVDPEAELGLLLKKLGTDSLLILQGDTVHSRAEIRKFYEKRENRFAFLEGGRLSRSARHLIAELQTVTREGLNPRDYHLGALVLMQRDEGRKYPWGSRLEATARAEFEILLADAFFRYGYHLLAGRIRPENLSDEWHISREEANLSERLETALQKDKVRQTLKELKPPYPEYVLLQSYLARFRARLAAGGFPPLPAETAGVASKPKPGKAAKGGTSKRWAEVCKRLDLEGLYAGRCPEAATPAFAKALRLYQRNHGLEMTGRLDAATIAEMNVPLPHRIRQLKLALEGWRWLPQDLGKRHIRVHIADFNLYGYEGRKPVLNLKVVVGKKEDSTPVFSDKMTAVVFNPYWNVPKSIAVEEILPEIRKDTSYLSRNNMEIVRGGGDDAPDVRPDSVNWDEVDDEKFPFRIRQAFGEGNALGRMKFVLENPFNIYLHDTPSKSKFEARKRAFSHGCIRVQNPMALALFALRDSAGIDKRKIEALLAKGDPETVKLPRPIPVHILYFTAFAGSDGSLQFRKDVYGWDKRLERELEEATVAL